MIATVLTQVTMTGGIYTKASITFLYDCLQINEPVAHAALSGFRKRSEPYFIIGYYNDSVKQSTPLKK
ncbi:hypothetical protein EA58_00280 [Photobacterium galatheae]|uniref:Uncharacterized protein n=1 Tax=Photobacterium galatheae TaxID=1654360 RepID=A0A066S0R9_9GAMM|nr:hypothetical protein EA58_00280 [Photobacterium galatheae]